MRSNAAAIRSPSAAASEGTSTASSASASRTSVASSATASIPAAAASAAVRALRPSRQVITRRPPARSVRPMACPMSPGLIRATVPIVSLIRPP